MKIFASVRKEKVRFFRLPEDEIKDRIKNEIALIIARFLEDKIVIKEETVDEHYTEYRTDLIVLSEADVLEIGEVILTFESYAKDYPAMYAVKEKLHRIREIFLKETL